MAKENKIKNWWLAKTNAQKAWFIISICLFIISTTAFVILMNVDQIFGLSGDKALWGEYGSGWVALGHYLTGNMLKVVFSLLTILFTVVAVFTVNFFIRLLSGKSNRSKTISSIVRSIIKYVAVIVDVGIVLSIFGVDVASIVAGVGILTLIIGLGCQSLIQDVVSGVFIVFDDYFSVGDIVIIDGFRGTVTDIGLRSTKVCDAGGNIKSINNSSISTVVNLSRYDTMIIANIPVAYTEDIERVEAIITDAMPEFKEKIPLITTGPYYKGISSIDSSSIIFMVLCFSKEADRFQVSRDLNRELILLFRKNDVTIPYNQIVINPAYSDDRPKASDIQRLVADRVTKENRGIVNEKPAKTSRKKRILDKVATSIEEAKKDTVE